MRKIDYAILRAWNNPSIEGLIAKLDPVVNKIIVVVNGPQDKINTPEILANSEFSKKIETIVLENYGWSKALNAGLRASMPKEDYETRLIISNEVNPTTEQLEEMQRQVLRGIGKNISGAYGVFTLGSYGLFKDRHEQTYQVPRNTFTLWVSKIIDGFEFNEKLDLKQGMEDVYMGLQIYEKKSYLPSLGPTDVDLNIREGVNIEEKTRKEYETVKEYSADFKPETIKAYFGALNVLNISKGRGGIPLFANLWMDNSSQE